MTAPGCLDPAGCPVPDPKRLDLRRLRLTHLSEGQTLHTAYTRDYWPDLFNVSGGGNGRFSPTLSGGRPVPTMYAARAQTVALLETSFHDVHQAGTRIVSERTQLATRGLAAITVPERLALVDLSDDGLARVGLTRAQLVATTPQHYACSQAWSLALHERSFGGYQAAGLLWRSRVAELAEADSELFADLLRLVGDVCVLFGDRATTVPGDWQPGDPHYEDLSVGEGRLLAEQIAEQLGAVIVPP
ncbi:MAG: RES family NAD+ phosphorylase [Candidatus Limnocylindria bacterium]